jgi:hypothetical protein
MATTDIYHISGGLKGRHAVAFLGGNVDDYLQVDAHAVARVAANDTVGTYSAWINVPDITGTYCILCGGDKNVVEFLELNIEAGLLTARCTDATTEQFVTQADAVSFVPHRWHHVAVVQAADGYGVRLYVDGVEIARTNDTATDVNEWYNNLDGIDSFRIGAANKAGDDSVTNEFKGGISNVKYWNKALTAEEVLNDSQNTALSDDATYLQLHLDMNEDYVDSGLGADNGTAVGGILLTNNYSEFTSRLRNSPAAAAVVADKLLCFAEEGTGHAVLIKAA